jgi:hypothetical protein
LRERSLNIEATKATSVPLQLILELLVRWERQEIEALAGAKRTPPRMPRVTFRHPLSVFSAPPLPVVKKPLMTPVPY